MGGDLVFPLLALFVVAVYVFNRVKNSKKYKRK
ncbi:hypothetical protein AX016_0961 [Cellulophaga sp. RHA19]|nr:hypothetical protein AX016_0961 [Cellulophaga sp. RHA19]